jgi:hypothetical protein
MSAAKLAARLGLSDDAVLKMLHGDSLKHVVQFCAVVDTLGYRVKFTKQDRPKRIVRLV